MKHVDISDKSIPEINWYDFKTANLFEDGSLMLIHIDKFQDRDSSAIVMFNAEEVNKLKELLNDTKSLSE